MKTEKQIEKFKQTLATRLKTARVEAGLSKNELANLSGISRQGIRLIEEGERTPSALTLWQLSVGMESSLSEILKGL